MITTIEIIAHETSYPVELTETRRASDPAAVSVGRLMIGRIWQAAPPGPTGKDERWEGVALDGELIRARTKLSVIGALVDTANATLHGRLSETVDKLTEPERRAAE